MRTAFSLLLLVGLAACSPRSENTLVVGMELNYPPFEMIDAQGKPAGISVEMAQALASSLGKTLRIENVPFDGLIPALKTGKLDLIISSMTDTPQRAQSIDFSAPYLRTGLCLLVNKAANIHSLAEADRAGYRIAVKQGTTGQMYAKEHLKQAEVLTLDKEDACVLEVTQGKAQGFIYDQMSVLKHAQQHPDSTVALLEPFQIENWAIGIRKGSDDLHRQVDKFIQQFKAEGGFARLGDKYLKEQKEAFRRAGVAFVF